MSRASRCSAGEWWEGKWNVWSIWKNLKMCIYRARRGLSRPGLIWRGSFHRRWEIVISVDSAPLCFFLCFLAARCLKDIIITVSQWLPQGYRSSILEKTFAFTARPPLVQILILCKVRFWWKFFVKVNFHAQGCKMLLRPHSTLSKKNIQLGEPFIKQT